MAKVGSKGDVSVRVGTQYDDAGIEGATNGLGDLDRKSSSTAEKMKQQWEKVKKNWLAIVGVIYSMKKAWDFANAAANFDQQEQAFTNLAASHGVNAKKIIADLKAMSGRMVSTARLMESAGSAMLLGIPADRLSEMMEIARAAAKVMGTSVQDAFNDIAKGIGRQSPLILDNLGITINLEKAYADYARQMKTTVAAMSDAEKKQAFLNAAMSSGQEIVRRVGKQSMNAAQAMAMFTATMADMKIVAGKVIITTTAALSGVAFAISKVFAQMLKTAATAIGKLDQLMGKLPFYKATPGILEFAEAQGDAAKEADRLMRQSFGVATAVWKEKEAVEGLTQKRKELNQIDAPGGEEQYDAHLQGYYDMIYKKIEANRQYFEQLNEMTVQADLSETERENLRHQRQIEKLQNDLLFLEEANMMTEELEAGFRLAKEQAVMQHERNMTAIKASEDAKKKKLTEDVANHEIRVKQSIASMTISLLRTLGGKNKAFAYAAIALEKGLAMAKAGMNTAVAFTKALTIDPTGTLSARVALLGKIQMGLIAATGLAQSASVGGGGASAGSPGGPPVQTEDAYSQSSGSVFDSGTQQQPTVIQKTYINVEGHVVDLADFARKLIPATEEAYGDGV